MNKHNFLLYLLLALVLHSCSGRGDYDPQAEIDRQGREQAQAESEVKFPADNSYQLQLTMVRDGKEDGATADIQAAFLRVLQSKMGNTGLNPHWGANKGEGAKGTIKIVLRAEQSEFGDGGARVFMPSKFDVEMTVSSIGDSCGWDGDHKLSAEKSLPGRVTGTSQRESQITALVEELASKLPKF